MAKGKKKAKRKPRAESAKSRGNDYAQRVLEGILSEVGDDSGAQLLGSDGLALKIKGVISTQCATLDAAIGRGGIPRSRLTILHGAEGSGKTSLALHIVAETQRLGGVAVYLDKEYKLDPEYAANIGVDTERLIIVQPPFLERAFQVFDGVIERAARLREEAGKQFPILVVLDSMNAAITKSQYEGEWDDQPTYGPQAKIYSTLLPKLIPKVSKEDVSLLWISQERTKIGVAFGPTENICGGRAPKFYASLIMEVKRRTASKSKDGEKIGNAVEVTCSKNQIAPPFKKGMCEIVYGKGINRTAALLDQAVKDEIVEKNGAYYVYNEQRVGHGQEQAVETLNDNDELREEIGKAVSEANNWERE